jgi:hypothetical protein
MYFWATIQCLREPRRLRFARSQGGELREASIFGRLIEDSLAVGRYQLGQIGGSLFNRFNVEVDHWRIGLQLVTKAQKETPDNF